MRRCRRTSCTTWALLLGVCRRRGDTAGWLRRTGKLGEQRVVGLHALADQRTNSSCPRHAAHVLALLGSHDRDDDTGCTSASRAAGAVEERLVFGRRIDVYDQPNVVDVNAARGNVGGNQH